MNDHITDANHLLQFGLNCLTGEACAYGMRLLFDVNEDGAALLRLYLGLPYDAKFAENWNSQVDGKPAIGSIMLTRASLPDLAIFALFHLRGCHQVLQYGTGLDLQGIPANKVEDYAPYIERLNPDSYRLHWNHNSNRGYQLEGRNVHQATGRAL